MLDELNYFSNSLLEGYHVIARWSLFCQMVTTTHQQNFSFIPPCKCFSVNASALKCGSAQRCSLYNVVANTLFTLPVFPTV